MPEPTPTHLRWPPVLVARPDGTATLGEVEQGTDQEIRRGLALACEIRPGQLPWDQRFGIPDPLGTTDPEPTRRQIERALQAIEPRAQVGVTLEDSDDGRILRPHITA